MEMGPDMHTYLLMVAITQMITRTLPASESKVIIWKFEFPGAQHLHIRDKPNNWRHFYCWTQLFGSREVPHVSHSTLFEEN